MPNFIVNRNKKGRGIFPAFWMFLEKNPNNGQPYGEIDIMEHVGYSVNITTVRLHEYDTTGKFVYSSTSGYYQFNNDNNFHTFKLDWNQNRLKFSVDNVNFQSYYRKDWTSKFAWPFDNKLQIIINAAIGGKWAGSRGIDDSIFPTSFIIDYVRQYQAKTDD